MKKIDGSLVVPFDTACSVGFEINELLDGQMDRSDVVGVDFGSCQLPLDLCVAPLNY